jgi:hypothetical protein
VSVLIIHGAGYEKDLSLRYLQRQRLRAGLTAGFIAAKRIAPEEAFNPRSGSFPFGVSLADYSEDLNRSEQQEPEDDAGETVTWRARERAPIKKLRCLCCPHRSRYRSNVRDWAGNVARNQAGVTRRYIAHNMPDVDRYLERGEKRERSLATIRADIQEGTKVVVAHSLGSVVAVDALASIRPECAPELLVTIGSPLRYEALRERIDVATMQWVQGRETAWVNVHDRADVVTAGGSLPPGHYPGVINVSVNNGEHYHSGDYYLRHEIVGALIWDVASGEFGAAALHEGVPASLAGFVRYRD